MNSKYRKTSGYVFTYAVTGPKAELDEYVIVMSAGANKTPEEWQRTPSGNPLFFIALNNLLRNGETPQPSYNLIKSHDGLRYFTDTTAQDMARFQRVAAASETEEGKLLAQVRLGIVTIGTQQRATPAVTNTPTPAIAAPADTIGSIIEGELGEDAVLEGEGAAAGAAGTGAIGD